MANDNNYLKSAASARNVGRNIANVIDFMVDEHGANLDDFHLIGHSLGERREEENLENFQLKMQI